MIVIGGVSVAISCPCTQKIHILSRELSFHLVTKSHFTNGLNCGTLDLWSLSLFFCISINTNIVKRYRKPICIMRIMSYSSVTAQVRHMLTRDQTVLPATHTFIHKLNKPYLPLTPSRRELPQWLVLISCPTEGRRLSWPKLLGEILRWFVHPKAVAHRSICHAAS